MQKRHGMAETKKSSLLIVVAACLLQSKNSDYNDSDVYILES